MKWTKEQLKTSRNLCDIALTLIDSEKEYLLPTVLELLLLETQALVDKYCVVSPQPNISENYPDSVS